MNVLGSPAPYRDCRKEILVTANVRMPVNARSSLAASLLSLGAIGLMLVPAPASRAQQTPPDTAPGGSGAAPASAAAKPRTHTVAVGDLTLDLDRDGRIDSAKRIKVRLLPEAYSGGFEVAEVLKSGGRVKKGDVLIRFDPEAMDKAVEDANVELDHAQRRIKIAQSEQLVMSEENATRLEQAQKARVKAEKEVTIWEKYDGPDAVKQAELSLQQRQFGLDDQKQELAQLEEMYSGTHLAQETKDIVLDRARRGVKMSEEYLKLAQNDETIAKQFRQPMQDEQVHDALRWAKEGEEHTKVGVANAQERKSMEMELAQRNLKEVEKKVKNLGLDRALLEVKAPADGVMTTIELAPRDNVGARQTICEVLDPSDLVVKFSAQPEDLRVLAPASGEAARQVAIRLPDFPEVRLTGTITDMAEMVSTGGGEANTIPVTVKIEGAGSPLVRLGLKCRVHAERTLKGVLTIPKSAVKIDGADAKVKVLGGDGQVIERTITIGPSSDDMTVVIDGLKAGDQVVIEDAKK